MSQVVLATRDVSTCTTTEKKVWNAGRQGFADRGLIHGPSTNTAALLVRVLPQASADPGAITVANADFEIVPGQTVDSDLFSAANDVWIQAAVGTQSYAATEVAN